MTGRGHEFKPGARVRRKTTGAEFVVFCATCRSYVLWPVVDGRVRRDLRHTVVSFRLASLWYEEVSHNG